MEKFILGSQNTVSKHNRSTQVLAVRGGVEDTRLEAKETKKSEAKDRPSRGQGHRRKCSPEKKVFKNFLQAVSNS